MRTWQERYPIGQVYRTQRGGTFKILAHGHLSLQVEGCLNGWIGVNEVYRWLQSGQIEVVEVSSCTPLTPEEKAAREAVLAELTAEAQEMGFYD